MAEEHEPSTEREYSRRAVIGGAVSIAGLAMTGSAPAALERHLGVRTAASSAKRGGTAQIAMGGANAKNTLDPGIATGSFELLAEGMLYDNLVHLDQGFTPRPALATAWSANRASTVWTFKLRDGVEFHDGTPFTARDVAYTVRRILDPKYKSPAQATLAKLLAPSGIRVLDKRTIQFRLKGPNGFLPVILGGFNYRIVKSGWKLPSRVVGTGPFRFSRFTAGEIFEVTRNPGYWQNNRPYLDRVRIVVIHEQSTKLQSVLSGASHLADGLELASAQSVQGSDRARLLRLANGNFAPIVLQASKPPFNKPDVLRALKMGVDRQRFVRTVLSGFGSPGADMSVPRNDPFYPPGFQPIAYNPDEARRLLERAGEKNLSFTLNMSQVEVTMASSALVFADMMKGIGVNVDVKQVPADSYWSQVWLKEPAYMSFWQRDHASTIVNYALVSSAVWPEPQFKNAAFDKLINQASRTGDLKTQQRLYHRALPIAARNSGWIVPAWGDRVWPAAKSLQGVQLDWTSLARLTDAQFV